MDNRGQLAELGERDASLCILIFSLVLVGHPIWVLWTSSLEILDVIDVTKLGSSFIFGLLGLCFWCYLGRTIPDKQKPRT